MDYINIISKEAIMMVPVWLNNIILGASIAVVLSTFVYWAIVKNVYKVAAYLYVAALAALMISITGVIICSTFFKVVPTGKYKYEATINKDKITVSQYEEFVETYDPYIINDVYYWQD